MLHAPLRKNRGLLAVGIILLLLLTVLVPPVYSMESINIYKKSVPVPEVNTVDEETVGVSGSPCSISTPRYGINPDRIPARMQYFSVSGKDLALQRHTTGLTRADIGVVWVTPYGTPVPTNEDN